MCFGIKIFPEKSIYVYYLLYKIHNSNLLWIVQISNNYRILENKIIKLTKEEKSIGKYLIIERYEKESIFYKKFQQFQLYELKLYDYVIYES